METTRKRRPRWSGLLVLLLMVAPGAARDRGQQILFEPGHVNASVGQRSAWLANNSIVVTWDTSGGGLRLASIYDRLGGRPAPRTGEAFLVTFADNRSVGGSEMKLVGPPRIEDVGGRSTSTRVSERRPGKALVADLDTRDGTLRVTWRAVLRDGADHVRQEVTLEPASAGVPVTSATLVDIQAADARADSTASESVAVTGGTFVGMDAPSSRCAVREGRLRCTAAPTIPLRAPQRFFAASVIGLKKPAETAAIAALSLDTLTEQTPADRVPAPLHIVAGPYLQEACPTAMTVMWLTDRTGASWVEYGPDGTLGTKAIASADGLLDADTRIHRVRLTGLVPDTPYTYRVVAREILHFGPYMVEYGEQMQSETSRFRTPPAAPRPFSFVVLNDLHEDVEVMSAHMRGAGALGADLVVFNGDSLSHLESEDQIVEKLLKPASDLFARRAPFVLVRGNHETRGRYARRLHDYLGLPDGRYYYSFDYGPVHFVVMDTGEDKEDGHWAYSGLTDFAAYRRRQAEWLVEEVKTPAFRDARFRVLIAHMPFFGNEGTQVDGYGSSDCRALWGELLNNAGLDLHIAGHTHRANWVPPAAGANRFPVLVGGSSQRGSSTMIRVDVSAERLAITVTREDGTILGTYDVAARKGRQ
jgi:hypothetical protein